MGWTPFATTVNDHLHRRCHNSWSTHLAHRHRRRTTGSTVAEPPTATIARATCHRSSPPSLSLPPPSENSPSPVVAALPTAGCAAAALPPSDAPPQPSAPPDAPPQPSRLQIRRRSPHPDSPPQPASGFAAAALPATGSTVAEPPAAAVAQAACRRSGPSSSSLTVGGGERPVGNERGERAACDDVSGDDASERAG